MSGKGRKRSIVSKKSNKSSGASKNVKEKTEKINPDVVESKKKVSEERKSAVAAKRRKPVNRSSWSWEWYEISY